MLNLLDHSNYQQLYFLPFLVINDGEGEERYTHIYFFKKPHFATF